MISYLNVWKCLTWWSKPRLKKLQISLLHKISQNKEIAGLVYIFTAIANPASVLAVVWWNHTFNIKSMNKSKMKLRPYQFPLNIFLRTRMVITMEFRPMICRVKPGNVQTYHVDESQQIQIVYTNVWQTYHITDGIVSYILYFEAEPFKFRLGAKSGPHLVVAVHGNTLASCSKR